MAQRSTLQAKASPPQKASSTRFGAPKPGWDFIEIKGAREHNLRNLSLKIPRSKFVVITGPSGSGKSSLAFDTIFAEGQRRYIESLSAYARQFVENLKKPEVDSIRGLCPSIAIQQKGILKNPRSTVGTLTEIYDFLRLLFSRVGDALCPNCEIPISSQGIEQIVDQILGLPLNARINVFAVMARKKKGEFAEEISQLVRSGIVRARIDGQDLALEKGLKLDKQKPHTIEAYIDRLVLKEGVQSRLLDAVRLASSLTGGQITIEDIEQQKTYLFSEALSCAQCGFSFPEMSPRLFSFNSPIGACTKCNGLGGKTWEEEGPDGEIREHFSVCSTCEGTRLKRESRSVKVFGRNISELCSWDIKELGGFLKALKYEGHRKIISEKILKEIFDRLQFLEEVGLQYLSLERRASTLSGGEEQRIRLATQIGTKLTGVLYVLDEPSIGLHQSDNQKLLKALKRLRDGNNTVIVVEHDAETMLEADHLIDMGPGAGREGGAIIEQGPLSEIREGVTAQFLRGLRTIALPKSRRKPSDRWVKVKKAQLHNLKNINVDIPLGLFTVVTGVSGSGKSTLVMDVLAESFTQRVPIGCERIEGIDLIERMISVDQSPIGRTPRSNPATYIGIFSNIRELFAQTKQSRVKGYTAGRFSFNVEGGRCATCKGAGELDVEMHFLADVSVTCDTCQGRRYNSETLEITFKGRNIFEVLEMSFDEANDFFESVPNLQSGLKMMKDVGLGYVKLGQSAVTLSGGEAQRIKLARELSKRPRGSALYILDEPTTGLHFQDVERLIDVIQQLVERGQTVVMIEHHLDVIKSADHVIDLGPGAGREGGTVLVSGTPEQVANEPKSATGKFLKPLL